MAGFVLRNTLSDNGGSRGICKVDEDNFLTDVVETKNKVAPFNNKMNNIRIDLCTDYK